MMLAIKHNIFIKGMLILLHIPTLKMYLRLWLNEEFPHNINDVPSTSAEAGIQGLTKETAEALIFTAKNTYLGMYQMFN
jgi:hypothetical protein